MAQLGRSDGLVIESRSAWTHSANKTKTPDFSAFNFVSALEPKCIADTQFSPRKCATRAPSPCQPVHTISQFLCTGSGKPFLSVVSTQRWVFFGCNHLILASYALRLWLIAQVCDLQVGDLFILLETPHLYVNYILGSTAALQLTVTFSLPNMRSIKS